MKTVDRPLAQIQGAGPLEVEAHPKFERSFNVVDPRTQAVVGYIDFKTAREIAEWVRRFS